MGIDEGFCEGLAVGNSDGDSDGDMDGENVRTISFMLGISVGDDEGRIGIDVGDHVGRCDESVALSVIIGGLVTISEIVTNGIGAGGTSSASVSAIVGCTNPVSP